MWEHTREKKKQTTHNILWENQLGALWKSYVEREEVNNNNFKYEVRVYIGFL